MTRDIEIDIEGAFRQAPMTAQHYLSRAYDILKSDYTDFEVRDAIALAHIMALDFNATIQNIRLQQIRDSMPKKKYD